MDGDDLDGGAPGTVIVAIASAFDVPSIAGRARSSYRLKSAVPDVPGPGRTTRSGSSSSSPASRRRST